MDVEAEIRELKRRVGELEGSFGFLSRQVAGVHKDLLDFEARTEARFEKIDKRFEQVDSRFDKLDQKFEGLTKALPGIVSEALRETLRERDKRS